jgi:transcriptional regulator GlxA family with amidase domain
MLLGCASAVKEAAYSCGFTEMGRFSVYYRELFGESPSTTLRNK